jgi:hypothetical protein
VVTDTSGRELSVTINEDATNVAYRILTGTAIACADRGFHPIFLSPTPAASTAPLRPYESDLRYMCIRFKDPHTCALNADGTCPSPCTVDTKGVCNVPTSASFTVTTKTVQASKMRPSPPPMLA